MFSISKSFGRLFDTYLRYLRHFATLLESLVANRPTKVVSNIESVVYCIFFNVYFLVYLQKSISLSVF